MKFQNTNKLKSMKIKQLDITGITDVHVILVIDWNYV